MLDGEDNPDEVERYHSLMGMVGSRESGFSGCGEDDWNRKDPFGNREKRGDCAPSRGYYTEDFMKQSKSQRKQRFEETWEDRTDPGTRTFSADLKPPWLASSSCSTALFGPANSSPLLPTKLKQEQSFSAGLNSEKHLNGTLRTRTPDAGHAGPMSSHRFNPDTRNSRLMDSGFFEDMQEQSSSSVHGSNHGYSTSTGMVPLVMMV